MKRNILGFLLIAILDFTAMLYAACGICLWMYQTLSWSGVLLSVSAILFLRVFSHLIELPLTHYLRKPRNKE